MQYIGLLDCNNFFVSCERLFRPDLWKKPVVVLSSNDGCVVARSQEVKDMGIPMGIPYFKVREKFRKEGVIVFSSNFTFYRDVSKRVMQTLATCVDEYQVYSVDEAFFVLEGEDIEQKALTVKQKVEQWAGVPVSIGVGRSKTIAKYASEVAKRHQREENGVFFYDDPLWNNAAPRIEVAELWGVGRKTSEKMRNLNINTVADILKLPPPLLRQHFGIEGERLQLELRGTSVRTLTDHSDMQTSIMSSRSFGETTMDRRVLEDAVAYHISHAAEKMRKQGCAARYLSVSIRPRRHNTYAGRGGFEEIFLGASAADTRILISYALSLLRKLYERDIPYGKAGVVLGSFVPLEMAQGTLFDDTSSKLNVPLMHTVDTLNKRFGADTVRSGVLRKSHAWQSSAHCRSECYTTNWGKLKVVKA